MAKSQTLPEMDLPKDRVLDRLCKRIAESRDAINDATTRETEDKGAALKRMIETSVTAYKRHGVELVHTQTDKLRVRRIDDDETGEDE